MSDIIRIYTQYLPLITLVIVVFVILKRKFSACRKLSLKSLFIGISVVGIAFFIVGMFIGNEIYCVGSKYAECTLGGILVGGPIGFTLATSVYLYYWYKNDKNP